MASYGVIVSVEHITRSILVLRGTRVILDRDLAAIYGVTTGRPSDRRHPFGDTPAHEPAGACAPAHWLHRQPWGSR